MAKNKGGRPEEYNKDIAAEIVRRCMEKNLYQVCKSKDMPNRDTVYNWLARHDEFADKYARACKIRRENRFEALEEVVDKDEDVQRSRLRVDVIKWQLSKEEPRKYGDRLELDGNVNSNVTFINSVPRPKKDK